MNVVPLAAALVLGVSGSAHCAAMCGGIAVASQDGRRHLLPRVTLARALARNAGRVTTYAVLGAVAGSLGGLAPHAVGLARAGVVLESAAALVLVATGLSVAGLVPSPQTLGRGGLGVWRHVAPLARSLLPVRSAAHGFVFGLLWGLMPCGMVYAALAVAAASGSAGLGALTMATFGVGTFPALITLGAFARRAVASANANARAFSLRRAAGIVVLTTGLLHAGLASARGISLVRADAGHPAAAPCCHGHDHAR
jgi:sulfite exporter TauE/SafE